jgi:outer membrane protein assembly factor BamB
MTEDFFSTRFAREPVDAPDPRPAFVAGLRRQLEAEWSDDREALQMVMTEERPTRQTTEPPNRSRRRYALLAAAAAVIAAVAAIVVSSGEDETRIVDEPSTTTTAPAPTSVGEVDLRNMTDDGRLPVSVVGSAAGLWAMTGGDLQRVDLADGSLTTTLRLADRGPDEGVDDAIFPANDALYVALYGIGIAEVTADGSTLVRQIDIPTIGAYRGISIAVSPDTIWATVNGGDQIVTVDLASGTVSEPIEIAGGEEVRKLLFDGRWLYATASKGAGRETLYKLDPATLAERGATTLPVYLSRGVLFANDMVWVSGDIDNQGEPSVSAIDIDTMTIRWSVTPDGSYGQRLVARDGLVWVGLHMTDTISGIDVDTGVIVATLELPGPPTGANDVAVDPNGALWVSDAQRVELLRFTITG